MKSTDGGRTFQAITGMDDDVHRTVINTLNPDRIYVTGGDGTYVTSDGGTTWEHWMTTEHEVGAYPDLMVLHPRKPDLVFVAAAQHGPGAWPETRFAGSRISKSTDGGRTWEALQSGLPDRLQSAFEAMSLEDWGDSFSIFGAMASGEVWASDDGGEAWSQIVTGLPPVTKGSHDVIIDAGLNPKGISSSFLRRNSHGLPCLPQAGKAIYGNENGWPCLSSLPRTESFA